MRKAFLLAVLLSLAAAPVAASQPVPYAPGDPGCSGIPVNGDVTAGDPTQTSRLLRDGIADTCASPGTCGTPIAGTYHYQAHAFRNYDAATACVNLDVTTTCTGTNVIYVGVYSPTFDPANI